jgi:GNAT superfamily N-acetyltransferase
LTAGSPPPIADSPGATAVRHDATHVRAELNLEVVEFARLSGEHRSQLEEDEDDPFDSGGLALQFRAKERHVALMGQDGRLVASTGMLLVDVVAGCKRFAAVGIGGVIVNQRHRRRGLARQVVGAALTRAATLGPDFALLFCREDRSGLYLKLGFTRLDGLTQVQQPDGYVNMPLMMMWRALRPGAGWPSGAVRLLSLPF